MRLLCISPTLRFGGTEKYALTIAEGARRRRGWDATVLFSTERATPELFEQVRGRGLTPMAAGIGEGGDHPRHQPIRFLRGLDVLRRIRPDVVHVNVPWPDRCLGLICACALLRVPTVVTTHLIPRPFDVSPRHRRGYTWARQHGRQTWTAVSEHTRQLLCDAMHWHDSAVLRIYNGVPPVPPIDPSERRACRARVDAELGLPPDAVLLLTTGRLVPQKGLNRLIQAAPHLAGEWPDVRVVCVGEGGHRDELEELAHEYGVADVVRFVGQRADVATYLRAADLFVFPTLYEGFGLSLVEAMAHGLPVVSSDASNIPEIITHREHGLLCRPDDSASLLEALRWALRHPAEMAEMGRNARARAADFTEERMVRQTTEALEAAASHHPHGVAHQPVT